MLNRSVQKRFKLQYSLIMWRVATVMPTVQLMSELHTNDFLLHRLVVLYSLRCWHNVHVQQVYNCPFPTPVRQLTASSMHKNMKSSGKELICYGVWVTVHIHTHETLSVYCRQMCFVTFIDLPCTFLSLDDKRKDGLCDFPSGFSNILGTRLLGVPFNERL